MRKLQRLGLILAFGVTLWIARLDVAVKGQQGQQGQAFDLVITGGRIVDGTGNPWFIGDVAVRGETIAAIGAHIDPRGARTIDAQGLVVAPGFIDVHSHSEAGDDGQGGIVGNPQAENYVRQGVTTIVASPDGGGSAQVAVFLGRVAAARPTVNVGTFIGHGVV